MIEEVEKEEDYEEDDIDDLAAHTTRLNKDQREHFLTQMIREDANVTAGTGGTLDELFASVCLG
jgi:hypothetical protein